MLGDVVSGTAVFVSSGLFLYFCARALLLLRASEQELNRVLDADLAWSRKMRLVAAFFP
jgi:hypothetical protein